MTQSERTIFNEGLLDRYGKMANTSAVETLAEALSLDIETGEHFRVELSPLDRMIFEETIIADDQAIVDHVPSSLPPHHRTARRWEKKFKVSGKMASLAAYALYFISGLEKESTQWFEGLVEEQGFDSAFSYLRGLYFEMKKLDAEDTDALGKIENGLPEGGCFHTMPVIPEDGEEYENKAAELYREFSGRIRRAGVHQLGAIGKDLYESGREMGYELTNLLWSQYRERKESLRKYRRVA